MNQTAEDCRFWIGRYGKWMWCCQVGNCISQGSAPRSANSRDGAKLAMEQHLAKRAAIAASQRRRTA